MFSGVQKSKGFTLIELVVVIVILGVLAATVAPKFIDLTSDAKISVLKGTEGSIKSVLKMLHMKAQIQGQLDGDVTVETQYGDYQFHRGYPEIKSEATSPNLYFIETFLDLGTPENEVKNNTTRTATYGELNSFEDNFNARIGYGTGNLLADECYVYYIHTASEESWGIVDTGC